MSDPSENPKFDRKSGSRNTPELPPSESDFWDLDDDTGPEAPAATPEPRTPEPTQAPPSSTGDALPADTSPDKVLPSEEPSPEESRSDDGKGDSPHSLGEAATDLAGRVSKSEKIAILAVGAGVLLIAIWGLSLFFGTIPTESPDAAVDFPVEGNFATMVDAETYWREPNPESDRGVRNGTSLIPAAVLTLDAGTQSGALRILFRDDSERIIGDPITVPISGGKFPNGSDKMEVYATEGFSDEGDHAAYLTEQIGKWFLVVTEGPDPNAPGSKFSDLFRTPISNTRH